MKGRESGMPSQEVWEGFFDPTAVLEKLGVTSNVNDIAEFGCGYGTFTIPAAMIVKGTVHAIDVDAELTESTRREGEKLGLRNINVIHRDCVADGTGLNDTSVDYAMLFNFLHIEHPEIMLKEAWRILRPNGRLGIMHWNYDSSTPRGPSMAIRPKPEQCIDWASVARFSNPRTYDLKPYHYGIVMEKRGE